MQFLHWIRISIWIRRHEIQLNVDLRFLWSKARINKIFGLRVDCKSTRNPFPRGFNLAQYTSVWPWQGRWPYFRVCSIDADWGTFNFQWVNAEMHQHTGTPTNQIQLALCQRCVLQYIHSLCWFCTRVTSVSVGSIRASIRCKLLAFLHVDSKSRPLKEVLQWLSVSWTFFQLTQNSSFRLPTLLRFSWYRTTPPPQKMSHARIPLNSV